MLKMVSWFCAFPLVRFQLSMSVQQEDCLTHDFKSFRRDCLNCRSLMQRRFMLFIRFLWFFEHYTLREIYGGEYDYNQVRVFSFKDDFLPHTTSSTYMQCVNLQISTSSTYIVGCGAGVGFTVGDGVGVVLLVTTISAISTTLPSLDLFPDVWPVWLALKDIFWLFQQQWQ